MILKVSRNDLDTEKYNTCISNSLQCNVFGYSWYLDIVSDSWSVLVLNNYEAVMPIPIRKKYGIHYVYPPFWLLNLGVYSSDENIDVSIFISFLFQKFLFVELKMNSENNLQKIGSNKVKKQIQYLSLKNSYSSILSNFKKDRQKDIRKAQKEDFIEKWDDAPENLIELFKNNVGKRTTNIKSRDYGVLLKLINKSIAKKKGELLSIYNKNDQLVASAFFLKNKGEITILVSSTDFNNRNNGVNTYLIDRAIFKYQPHYETFNFGGSSIKSIANYFKSFNATTKNYFLLKKKLL